jgi:hypothetical protein
MNKMNKKKAYVCLDLDIKNHQITLDNIKRQYRLKALTYHPDKNTTPDATNKFQEIHDAYEYVLKNEGYDDYNSDDNNLDDTNVSSGSYKNIVMLFIRKILEDESNQTAFYNIINRITNLCEEKAIEMLKQLDKTVLIKTHKILVKYKHAFHITEALIVNIENIIKNKNENDECILLNPTLMDLYENNLYKLTVNNETYIIPLWHHELVYDNGKNDLYVNCLPDLPNNIDIDENNNIHIYVEYDIYDIWKNEYISINCGLTQLPVQVNTLRLIESQTVIFAKKGITKINTTDIYDISKKGDVYIHFKLLLGRVE